MEPIEMIAGIFGQTPARASTSTLSETTNGASTLIAPFTHIDLSSPLLDQRGKDKTRRFKRHPLTLTTTWKLEACSQPGAPLPTPNISPLTPSLPPNVDLESLRQQFRTTDSDMTSFSNKSLGLEEQAIALPQECACKISSEMLDLQTKLAHDSHTGFGTLPFLDKSAEHLPQTHINDLSSSSLSSLTSESESVKASQQDRSSSTDSSLSSLGSLPLNDPSNDAVSDHSSSSSLTTLSSRVSEVSQSLIRSMRANASSLISAYIPFLLDGPPSHAPDLTAYALPQPKALSSRCQACFHPPTTDSADGSAADIKSDLPFRNLYAMPAFPSTCIHLSCSKCYHPLPGALSNEDAHPQPCIYEIPRHVKIEDDAEADAEGDVDIPSLYTGILTKRGLSNFFGEVRVAIPEKVWEALFACLVEERIISSSGQTGLSDYRALINPSGLRQRREIIRTFRANHCCLDIADQGIEGDETANLVYFEEGNDDAVAKKTTKKPVSGGRTKKRKSSLGRASASKRRKVGK